MTVAGLVLAAGEGRRALRRAEGGARHRRRTSRRSRRPRAAGSRLHPGVRRRWCRPVERSRINHHRNGDCRRQPRLADGHGFLSACRPPEARTPWSSWWSTRRASAQTSYVGWLMLTPAAPRRSWRRTPEHRATRCCWPVSTSPPCVPLPVGDVGARAFLALQPELVTRVECADIGNPADIDTPDDVRRGGLV